MNTPRPLIAIAVLLSTAFVACGLFQPAQPQTTIAATTFPATISSAQVLSVTPGSQAVGVAPNSSLSVNFASGVDQASAQAQFVALPGLYTTDIGTQKLTLTAMCDGRWRVRNPASSTVVFTWDVYNTTVKGSGIVPGASDVFFSTSLGQKTVRVFVAGVLHNTKAANTTPCNSTAVDVPGKLSGNYAWSANTLTFTPTQVLSSKQAYTIFVGLAQPYASAFEAGGAALRLSSATPSSFSNDREVSVKITGEGFNSNTSFFIQSNRLELLGTTPTEATVRVPAGFLPSIYGLMSANNDGTRTTLYPALTITQGAAPREIDPQRNARAFVEGYVRNYATGAALAGARVSLNSLSGTLEALSDASGYYLIRGVPSGKQSFSITKDGFEPVYRIANIASSIESYTLKLAALEPKSARTTIIGTTGGTHYATDQGANGPYLQIPAGALENNTPIQFTQLRDATTLPELPQDGSFLAFAHLGPTGLTFKKPATLFLPLQAGISIAVGTRINIFYFDAKRAEWVDDITSGKISNVGGKLYLEYEINHFTWIGGTWFPDPVTGCAKYPDGTPASRVMTNYGVTNAAGIVNGSTTRSQIGRILTLEAIGRPGSTTSNAPYTDGSPVNFPCITVPAPEPVDFKPVPVVSNSCGNAPVIAPFGTRALEGMQNPVVRQDSSGDPRQIVMAQDTFGFSVEIPRWKYSQIDPSSLKLELGGVDYTSRSNFVYPSPNDPEGLQVKLTLSEPLRSQTALTVTVKAVNSTGNSISRSALLDIVASFEVLSLFAWKDLPENNINVAGDLAEINENNEINLGDESDSFDDFANKFAEQNSQNYDTQNTIYTNDFSVLNIEVVAKNEFGVQMVDLNYSDVNFSVNSRSINTLGSIVSGRASLQVNLDLFAGKRFIDVKEISIQQSIDSQSIVPNAFRNRICSKINEPNGVIIMQSNSDDPDPDSDEVGSPIKTSYLTLTPRVVQMSQANTYVATSWRYRLPGIVGRAPTPNFASQYGYNYQYARTGSQFEYRYKINNYVDWQGNRQTKPKTIGIDGRVTIREPKSANGYQVYPVETKYAGRNWDTSRQNPNRVGLTSAQRQLEETKIATEMSEKMTMSILLNYGGRILYSTNSRQAAQSFYDIANKYFPNQVINGLIRFEVCNHINGILNCVSFP